MAPRPLDAIERTLLARIGAEGSDEQARRVLADHWQEGTDEPRGLLVLQQCEGVDASALIAEHGDRWLRTAYEAGFRHLELERGFVATALVVERGDPLLACADAMRLSPRKYLLGPAIASTRPRAMHEVVAHTLAGEHGRYVIEHALPIGGAEMTRDATILAKLHHPNLSELFDLAFHRDHGLCVVLTWPGEPLSDHLRDGAGGEPFAIAIGLALCDALAALADAGIVHAQISSATVMLRDAGHVTLAGFERAKAPGLPLPDLEAEYRLPPHPVRYRYMSPEQARGQIITPMSDLFSLALLLAEIAQRRHPLAAIPNAFEVLRAIIAGNYELGAKTPLAALLAEALVADPGRRPSLASFRARLASF